MSTEVSADDMRETARRLTVASVTMGDVNCAAVMRRTLAAEREQEAQVVSTLCITLVGKPVGVHGTRESIEALDAYLSNHVATVAKLRELSELFATWSNEKTAHSNNYRDGKTSAYEHAFELLSEILSAEPAEPVEVGTNEPSLPKGYKICHVDDGTEDYWPIYNKEYITNNPTTKRIAIAQALDHHDAMMKRKSKKIDVDAVRKVIYELTRKEVLHAPYVMRCASKLSAAIGEE